jgi:hypothetical protein
VPADHEVRAIAAVVDQLDLRGLYADVRARGEIADAAGILDHGERDVALRELVGRGWRGVVEDRRRVIDDLGDETLMRPGEQLGDVLERPRGPLVLAWAAGDAGRSPGAPVRLLSSKQPKKTSTSPPPTGGEIDFTNAITPLLKTEFAEACRTPS